MKPPTRLRRAAAWAVHGYTASGVLLALAALRAVGAGDFRTAFLWLALAVLVDATDGVLARAVDVKRVVPEIDGAHLDDIIDYLTFVFVPIALMHAADLLVGPVGLAAGGLALLVSALRFVHRDAKTADHFFTGFPSYWNVVAFYCWIFAVPAPLCAALVLVLSGLVPSGLRFVYPSRMTWLRGPTVVLGILWGAALLVLLWQYPEPPTGLATASLLYPAYYSGLSFYLQCRDRRISSAATR
jgi:phosphatidylcholine synthase